jgi:F-type H+-transporting ATPase subunit a
MNFDLFAAPTSVFRVFAAEETELQNPWWIFAYYVPVFLVIGLFIWAARAGITRRQWKGRWALYAEHLYLFLDGMARNVIGPHGRKYVPMLLAFWLLIFVSNFFGLIFDFTPSADWSLNIALAVIVVFFVQMEGIKQNGVLGHLKHFAGPKMVGIMVVVSGLIFVVEIVSELMKLLSLSIRLYGNIHGGHIAVSALNTLVGIPIGGHTYYIPVGGLILPIKFLTCVLQAYVFVFLTCIYLSLVTHAPHDEHDEAHGDGHGAPKQEALAAA